MVSSAVDAWSALGGDRPDRVEILKEDRGTTVCRLLGVGAGGAAVIAKRSPHATATVEQAVYEQCLRGLPLPMPRYYGSIEDADSCWLFVEEARGARFHADKGAHRLIVGRWLGALHRAVDGAVAPPALPSRRPTHYLALLRSQQEALRLEQPDPSLDALSTQCDRLSARWAELEDACRGAPDTLVHGDIVAHNACIRQGPGGGEFLLFDWEKAGWGAAAEDLSIADLDAYADAVGAGRPDDALRRLAAAGRAFRCLVYLEWLRPTLTGDRSAALDRVRQCTSWIGQLLERAPWRP